MKCFEFLKYGVLGFWGPQQLPGPGRKHGLLFLLLSLRQNAIIVEPFQSIINT